MSKGGLPISGRRNDQVTRHHRVMHSIPALMRIAHGRSAKDSDRRIGCCVVLPIFETWGKVPLSKRVDDTAEASQKGQTKCVGRAVRVGACRGQMGILGVAHVIAVEVRAAEVRHATPVLQRPPACAPCRHRCAGRQNHRGEHGCMPHRHGKRWRTARSRTALECSSTIGPSPAPYPGTPHSCSQHPERS